MSQTTDGYLWTPTRQQHGLDTQAVVTSSAKIRDSYDALVVGAGFAGLVAARDISQLAPTSRVLLIEARDRIGGRTWTAKHNDAEYEMGGTWVHWSQPHVYAELCRCDLEGQLMRSFGDVKDSKSFLETADGHMVGIGDSEAMLTKAQIIMDDFFGIDGHDTRSLMPYPHDPFRQGIEQPWKKYDHLSIKDRLDQLVAEGKYTQEDLALFETIATGTGISRAEKIGFVEFVRWTALSGHTLLANLEATGCLKIGSGGTTLLAKRILGEYRGDLLMSAPVAAITSTDISSGLTLQSGRTLTAKSIVCTVPLNTLKNITFDPPFSPLRQEAIAVGHINHASKVHYRISRPGHPGWFMTCHPKSDSQILTALPDDKTVLGNPKRPSAGTDMVAFGYSEGISSVTNHDLVIRSFHHHVAPSNDIGVEAYLAHDWSKDPFSEGAWCCFAPGFMSKYMEELQKPHGTGRVLMASADWSDGWRGFIDGAVDQGKKAARKVVSCL